jgi:hypothetical protein
MRPAFRGLETHILDDGNNFYRNILDTNNVYNRDSSDDIVTKLRVGRMGNFTSISDRGSGCSVFQNVQTGLGIHQASYSIFSKALPRAPSSECKGAEHKAVNLSPPSSDIKNE